MFKRFFSFIAGLLAAPVAPVPAAISATRDFSAPAYTFHARPDSRAFGMSPACRRLVRKNRLRAAGLAGSKI